MSTHTFRAKGNPPSNRWNREDAERDQERRRAWLRGDVDPYEQVDVEERKKNTRRTSSTGTSIIDLNDL